MRIDHFLCIIGYMLLGIYFFIPTKAKTVVSTIAVIIFIIAGVIE